MESNQAVANTSWEGHSRRAAHCASLSVILVSEGDRTDLERALASIAGRCRRLEAEIIVVRAGLGTDETLAAAYPCVRFLHAAVGATIAEMRDIGMRRSSGDIVALRTDAAVGDGVWLEAFDSTVGRVDEGVSIENERAIAAAIELPADAPAGDRRKPKAHAPAPQWLPPRRDRRDSAERLPTASPLDRVPSLPVSHEL